MPESIASFKRENSNLKDQLSVMADEIAKMKEMLLEQSKKPAATKDETVQSLEFMSKGFDDFERFRVFAGKELKEVRANCFCSSLLRTQMHMPRHTRARALSNKMRNDRAKGHCYSFAWI